MLVRHYTILPGGLVRLLQVERNCYEMSFLDICLSYKDFYSDFMIHCRSLVFDAALGVGNKGVGFNKLNHPFVHHTLHSFAKVVCKCY